MRIVIINWRSIKDPLEGGAERATFEFAKRWVKNKGAEVVWISPRYLSGPVEETVEGVKFVYLGKPLTRKIIELIITFPLFYFLVARYYFKKLKNNTDIVIDQVHGLPYLTPLYIKEKKVIYIHEVAGSIWDLMYPFPINLFGKLLEKLFFIPYRLSNIKFIANSPSTVRDLKNKLHIKDNNIQVVPYGVTAPNTSAILNKYDCLTVIFLNRVVKMKGIERGIKAFSLVVKEVPDAQLLVIGRGEEEYIDYLKNLCRELKVEKNVKFIGFVDGNEKFDMLAKAHVLMNPSHLEGWGLVNIEANRMGTPVVAFKVRGCMDSVIDNISGYLCEDDNIKQMSEMIIKASNNFELRKSSQNYSHKFDWDLQAEEFYKALDSEVRSL